MFSVSCGGSDGGSQGGGVDSSGSAKQARRFLSVGTAPPGGAFFVVGGALAEVLNAHSDDLNWQVTAEATKGTQENIRRLSQGELDFALANAAISYFGVRGEEGWEQVHEVRAVMTLAPNVALFVAPRSGEVDSIAGLRGRRVVLGPSGAGFNFFLRPILAAHGLGYDDLDVVNATQSGAVDLIGDGSAAAAFLGGAVPTASITQAATTQDLMYVPYDAEAVTLLVEEYPFFGRASIPAGTYKGLEEEYAGMNVGSMHLITSAAVDEGLVYEVTRRLYENRAEVVAKHPAGKAIQPGNIIRDTGTPFHPGAIRFYREIGIWPDSDGPDSDDES